MASNGNEKMEIVKKAWNFIHEKEAIDFLDTLVNINSMNPPGKEKKVAQAIQRRLENPGLDPKLDEVAEERTNLIVTLPVVDETGAKSNHKVLTYSGHFDTVPLGREQWDYDPLGGERVGNLIMGEEPPI